MIMLRFRTKSGGKMFFLGTREGILEDDGSGGSWSSFVASTEPTAVYTSSEQWLRIIRAAGFPTHLFDDAVRSVRRSQNEGTRASYYLFG